MKNLPTLKVKIPTVQLTLDILNDLGKYTEAYLVAVKSEPNNPLKFTVYLETGALWSGLAVDNLISQRFISLFDLPPKKYHLKDLQPYSCLSETIEVIEYRFMKNAQGNFKVGNELVNGTYLFTIDTHGSGTLADDPEQYKTWNMIELDNGQVAALPNNYCFWVDSFFYNEEKAELEKNKYRRNTNYPLAGG